MRQCTYTVIELINSNLTNYFICVSNWYICVNICYSQNMIRKLLMYNSEVHLSEVKLIYKGITICRSKNGLGFNICIMKSFVETCTS